MVAALGGSDAFLGALDLAGTYGITVLFGILPAVMSIISRARAVENLRLHQNISETRTNYIEFVPGGSTVLISIIVLSVIVVYERIVLTLF